MKIALLVLAVACVPASAQWQLPDLGKQVRDTMAQAHAKKAAAAQAAKADPAKQRAAAVESALVAMNDGPEVGGLVAIFVRDNKIAIGSANQAALSSSDAKAKTITLADALPNYPRPLAIRIAREAAPMILAGMPESSEKEYMKRSITARVWLELGGEAKNLPVTEPLTGYRDQVIADEVKSWVENKSEMALYKIGEETKSKSLMELMDAEKDAAKKQALQDANKRFVDFLISENSWRDMYPQR